jgi:hypothetical protein
MFFFLYLIDQTRGCTEEVQIAVITIIINLSRHERARDKPKSKAFHSRRPPHTDPARAMAMRSTLPCTGSHKREESVPDSSSIKMAQISLILEQARYTKSIPSRDAYQLTYNHI